MANFFSALDAYRLGLQPRLAATVGLPEALVAAVAQEALPVMVRTLGGDHHLGEPAAVWSMCQAFALAKVHSNLAELTQAAGGWPEQRRYLAQRLLGPDCYTALLQHHAPTAPTEASELLGCLGLILLAAAGQHSLDSNLDATEFHHWLQHQATGSGEWQPQPNPSRAESRPALATTERTAPWWPLAVLAGVGIIASSYFWQEQVALTGRSALKAVKAAVATVAPMVGFTSTPDSSAVAAPVVSHEPAEVPAVEDRVQPAVAPLKPVRPAIIIPIANVESEKLPPNVLSSLSADTAATGRTAPGTGGAGHNDKPANGSELSRPAPAGTTMAPAATGRSAESLLFKRLMTADLAKQQPITLEHMSFAPGQATLDVAGTQQLENIAALLKSFPRCQLIVFGHADASEPTSLALDRANAVVAELRKQGVRKPILQAQASVRSADKADSPNEQRSPTLFVSAVK